MDPRRLEILQKHAAALQRRLFLAVAGLIAIIVSVTVGVVVQNVRAQPNPAPATEEVTKADLDALQHQVNEFRAELAAYGVRLTAVEDELRARKAPPTGQITTQQAGGYWAIVTTKMQFVEGKGVMQVMGPLPSAAMCDALLNSLLGALRQDGIPVESSACRRNVAIVVPK